jgi:hypothetical protein
VRYLSAARRTKRVVSPHHRGKLLDGLGNDPASASRGDAAELLVVAQGEAHLTDSSLDLEPAPSDDLISKI